MITKHKVMPKLRFREFKDDWSFTKIEDLFDFKNGLNKEKEFFGKGTPIINFMDVYKLTSIRKNDIKGLVELTSSELSRFSAIEGDVLFTRTSETIQDIGMSATLVEPIENCVFSGFVLRARPKTKSLSKYFTAHLFSIESVRKEITTKSSMTTRALTSGTLLNKVNFHFPSLSEQQKLASFLSAVDEKLQQLTKKKELLKEYKKGVMQKIFSQELRFKDDNSNNYPNWKEKKLGEVIEEYKKKSKVDNEYPMLTSSNKGLMLQSDYYGENRLTGRSSVGYNIIPEGYLTYRSRSDNSTFTFNLNSLGFTGVISTYYPVFKMTNCSTYFILSLLNNNKNYIGKFSVGTSQTVLSIKQVGFLKFKLPSISEQKKIANFLSSLDIKIELVSNQIKNTKAFKKGLLQQMFV